MLDLRSLPRVDDLAASPALSGFSEPVRKRAARAAIASMREAALNGDPPDDGESLAHELAQIEAAPSLRPAVNLSGVILHTGLGRARLAPSVAAHIAKVAGSHSLLEFDEESGKRGDRQAHVRELLQRLVGCEDALVVNNAAAGVLLTLSALCTGRGVVLSRGEMVEIGGSFRLPDIVRSSGCNLIEAGCTNKTHLSDYAATLEDSPAAFLRCHPSNYRIVGFASTPSLRELANLAKEAGALVIDDQGNGSLVEPSKLGLGDTFSLPYSILEGADIAVASGDKLLGGPQSGLIVGNASLIGQIRRHPLARATRIDKLCLAALEATLKLYSEGREAEIPTIAALTKPIVRIKQEARQLASASSLPATISESTSEVGGGAAPGVGLPTWRTQIRTDNPEQVLAKLRNASPPIVGRIESGSVWLDPRTLSKSEMPYVKRTLGRLG